MYVRPAICVAFATGCTLTACKKPTPKMVAPVEINAPRIDPDALANTQAAADGKSGSVKLKYCVDTQGKTYDVSVVESFDSEVDAMSVEAVKGWTFKPATRDGEPYDFCTDVTFDLRLQ